MQQRHDPNVLAMELRLPCIKPPKLYMDSSRVWGQIGIRWGYKSEAKQGKHDYFSFLGTATLSEAIKQAVAIHRLLPWLPYKLWQTHTQPAATKQLSQSPASVSDCCELLFSQT